MRASHPAARTPAAAVTHTGTITGRLFAGGGPAGPPRPFGHQTFELSRTAGGTLYTIHTDSHGRFLIQVKPGDYVFSMAHMMVVISIGVTAGTHRLFHVVGGRTVRRNITVSNPEWG